MADMRILISAGLNVGKSIGDVNASIKALSKHPSLQKLELKINVDQSFVKSIQGFIDATKKLNVAMEQQNRVVKETQDVYKNLDGTVKQVTQQVLKNGEVIEKTKTVHDANKKAVNDESKSLQDQIRTLKQLEKELEGYTLAKTRANKNKLGETNSTTNTYKNDSGQQISVKLDQQGNVKNYSEINEILKQQQAALKSAETMDRAHYDALKSNKQRIEAMDKLHYQALQRNREIDRRNQEQSLKAAESLDRAHYQALKSNSERQIAQEKQHALALQQNAKRDQQYAQSVANTQQKINDARSKFSGNSSAMAGLNELEQRLNSIKNIGDFKSPLGNLNNDLKRTVQTLNEASKSSNSFGKSLTSAFASFPIWMITGGVFAGVTQFFTQGISYVNELNKSLTELSVVYMEGQQEVKKYADQFRELGMQMGVTTDEVAKGAVEFARQGLSQTETINRMESAVKYAKISNISFTESAKILTATVNSMNVDIDRASDVFSYLGDATASGAEEIGQAMQRVGGTAGSLGIEFEKVSSWIATISANTRESSFTIGNSIKSIIARVQSLKERGFDSEDGTQVNQVSKALAQVGIQLVDTKRDFRNFGTVMDELGAKWNTLSKRQQAYVATTVAGSYQQARFLNLMEDYGKSVELYKGALDSAGIANEKFALVQQGTEAHLNKMKVAMQGLWSDTFNSDTLRTIIDAFTVLIGAVAKVTQTFGGMGTILGVATLALLTFKSGLKTSILNTFGLSLKSVALATQIFTGSTIAARVAVIALQGALTFGIPLAIAAIVAGFSSLSNAQKENQDIIDKTNSKYSELTNTLKDAQSYYEENHEAVSKDSKVKDTMYEIQNQLIDSFGAEAAGLDLVNGKYDEQIDKLNQLKGKKLDDEIAENEIVVGNLRNKKYTNPILGQTITDSLNNTFFGDSANRNFEVADGFGFGDLDVEKYYEKLLSLKEQLQKRNKDIFASEALIPKNTQEWANALATVNGKIEEIKPTISQINKLEDDKKQKIKETVVEQSRFNDTQDDLFNSISKAVANQPTKEFGNSLQKISDSVLKFDGSNLTSVIKEIKEIPTIGSNTDFASALDRIASSASDADNAVSKLSDTASELSNLADSIETAKKEMDDLNKAQEELKDSNNLSISTVKALSDKYDDFIKKTGLSKDKIIEYIKAKKQEMLDSNKYEIEMTKTQIKETENRLKNMEIRISAIKKERQAMSQAKIDELNELVAQGKMSEQLAEKQIHAILNIGSEEVLDFDSEKADLDKLKLKLNMLTLAQDDLSNKSQESKKKNDQYNDSMSQTNEILTETQKKLKAVEAAQDALNSKKSRLKKGSEEYGKALKEEIKLLEKQAALLTEGIKDPSKLVSTKVTTTTKGGTGLDSMISEALSLSSSKTFKYSQAAKSNVSYDQFTATAVSDCSLFVQQMFKEFLDIKLPRTTQEQVKQGQAVTNKKDLQKGDLVFFNTVKGKANSHVGVYMGDGNFMQMGNSGLKQGNLNDKYWADKYSGARRIPGANAIPEVQPPSTSTSTKVTGKNADLINKYAGANGVDPALIKAIIQQESSNGANGIKNVMQVSSLGKNTSVESSIKTGTSMFAKYLNQTGNVEIALAMYNMGPGILDYFNKNGGYSVENMKKFSALQKSKTGSKVYGDVNYVGNVLRYYDGDTSSVSGGKSKNKYTLPSASDMDKAQADAREQRTTTYDNIYKARIDYIDNYVTIGQNKIDALDAEIAKSQGRQAKYDQVSANWRKEESAQIKSLTAQQKELVSQNINLDNLVKQNKITSGEFDKQKASNSTKWWELEQQKQEKYYAVIVSNLDEYEKKIDAAADKISLSKARMESLDEHSKEYQKELVTQIGLINEQRVATEKEILAVERQLKNEKLSLQNKEELSKRLQDLMLKNLEYNNAIYSIKSAAADKIIEAYKKQIEKQKDLALKAIDKQKEAEDKRHEARLKNLEEESDRFEEIIKRQLQELDRTSESDDYDKELKKKLDERQKIQDKINELALNNSYEAKAKRKELTDQLDAKNEEIDKFKLDRERELRKEGLNDQLEDRKKYLDKTKDAEDRTHDAITDNIDREKELTEQKYDDILEDEQRFYRMKQDLMSNDKTKVKSVIDELKGEYSKFFTFLQEQSLETSKQMQNMLDSLSMDQGKLDDFLNLDSGIGNNTGIGIGDGAGTGKGDDKASQKGDWDKYLSNKQKAENISKQVVQLQREKKPDTNKIKSLQAQFKQLKQDNDAMRSKWGFPDGSYDYLNKIKPFSAETGGMTPANMPKEGQFLLAHQKELILNKSDTGNLLKIIDVTRGIVDSVKSTFNPNIVKNNNTSTASSDNSIHIEKVEIHANDKDSGSTILTKLIDAAKAQSKRGILGNNYGFNL